jgi:SAM-dependent methyltransferase
MQSIEKHNIEIHQNQKTLEQKPLIRLIYQKFYFEIKNRLNPKENGLTVELGSGLGLIKEVIPSCITTDLFENPWLDRVESAYSLKFDDGSISNLILFDVWHHLQYPASALKEFHRVLRGEGRLILFDPAMGYLGRIIYGLFHHEPIGLRESITWYAPPNFKEGSQHYFAALGNCWRMFHKKLLPKQIQGWRLKEVTFYPALAYMASGGFSKPQLFPTSLLSLIWTIENFLKLFPALFACRMLVVLERN